MNKDNILEVKNVHKRFHSKGVTVKAVTDVSFEVKPGETIGIVGESGCGKSVTSLSIMQLVQAPQGQVVGGEIRFNSSDLGYKSSVKYELANSYFMLAT